MPKGHIEEDEEFETALRREIVEEAGLRELKLIEELGQFRYLFRPNQDVVDKTVTYFLVKSPNLDTRLTPDYVHSEVNGFL